jgi:hypothetical protein
MRTQIPTVQLLAYCFLCDRSLIDPATDAPVMVGSPALRQGVCEECCVEHNINPMFGTPVGTTA